MTGTHDVEAGPKLFGRRRASEPQRAVVIEERDFKKPQRPSGARLRELEAVGGRIAQRFQSALANYLRADIVVACDSPVLSSWADALHDLPQGDWLVPLASKGGDRAVLWVDESMQRMMIARLLGGTREEKAAGETGEADGERFEFEAALQIQIGPVSRAALHPFVRMLLREVNRLLFDGADDAFSVDGARAEQPPARLLRGGDAVATFGVRVRESADSGLLRLAVQARSLQRVLSDGEEVEAPSADPKARHQLEGVVRGLAMNVAVVLGQATIDLSEFLGLQAGDVLILDRRVGEALEVKIGGKPQFLASPGQSAGKLAVRLKSAIGAEGRR